MSYDKSADGYDPIGRLDISAPVGAEISFIRLKYDVCWSRAVPSDPG